MMGLLVYGVQIMSTFSLKQRSKLLANRNVKDVTEKSISFKPTFKIKAVHQYRAGLSPNSIFEEAGIPLELFKDDYCRNCLKKWVKKFDEDGEESFYKDNRGSGSLGRPKKENLEDLTYDELLALVEIQQEALDEVRKQNALARKKKL